MFNLQDPTQRTYFGTSRGRAVFHLRKEPLGSQYLKAPRILVLLEISAQFERHSLCLTKWFWSSHTLKKVFPFMIQWQSVISWKNLDKTNIYVYDLRLLVPSEILVVLWIFQNTVVNFTRKCSRQTYMCEKFYNNSFLTDILVYLGSSKQLYVSTVLEY